MIRCCISVYLEFSTSSTSKYQMMSTGQILKLKEKGKMQIFLFRIKNFHEIQIHFNFNKGVKGKFPVIVVSKNALTFGRHIDAGVVGPKKPYYIKFEEVQYDFFVYTNGTEIQFGEVKNAFLNVLGFYYYEELDSLPFVGFSSAQEADWIVEEAVSGDKIKIKEDFTTFLNLTCKMDSTDYAEWTLPDGLTSEDLTAASCVPTHSCYLSNITHDTSVSLASYRDHLGNDLIVLDVVKVGDVAIAWCTITGKDISIFATLTLRSDPIQSVLKDLVFYSPIVIF